MSDLERLLSRRRFETAQPRRRRRRGGAAGRGVCTT